VENLRPGFSILTIFQPVSHLQLYDFLPAIVAFLRGTANFAHEETNNFANVEIPVG
jgi:hypothetical protein